MPKFNVSRLVPLDVERVFDVTADVTKYSEFVPLVRESTIANIKTLSDGRTEFDSSLTISYRKLGISDVLNSHVVVDPSNHTVTATSSEGIVKNMTTIWEVTAHPGGGSDVSYTVDYTLKSKSLQFLMSGLFDSMVRKIMTAFEDRARKLYGGAAAIS